MQRCDPEQMNRDQLCYGKEKKTTNVTQRNKTVMNILSECKKLDH